MAPREIVFLHNPKAGGTSIASAIKTLYAPDEIAPVFDNSPSERDPSTWPRLKRYRFVGGHFGHEVRRSVLPGHSLITNFRDPVDRIYSMYAYWRKNVDYNEIEKYLPKENGPKYAHAMTFSEFVRSKNPFLSLYIDNFHTRQILQSGWLPWYISPIDVLIAKKRIKSMMWFYVCEHEKASVAWLSKIIPEMASLPRENVTNRGFEDLQLPTEEDKAVICARNSADLTLYRYAVERLEKISAKARF